MVRKKIRGDAFNHSPEELGHNFLDRDKVQKEAEALWFDPEIRSELKRYPDMEAYAYLFITPRKTYYHAVTDERGAAQYATKYELKPVARFDGIKWEDLA